MNKNEINKSQTVSPGEGIRNAPATTLFRTVNFELYVKPNLMIMGFGVVGIVMSGFYLAYMKYQVQEKNAYIAIAEDGTQRLLTKKSKWD